MAAEMDKIGIWSEVKLAIIREYLPAYSKLVSGRGFTHSYIDGFAGYGVHESRTTGEIVQGSPLIALNTQPPFRKYHFIDLNPEKAENLRLLTAGRADVSVHEGDCNEVLRRLLPNVRYDRFHRALCLLAGC
jgi:three-Cys-motif partner protein